MTVRGPKKTVVFERYTLTSDGGGGSTKTWTVLGEAKGVFTAIKGDTYSRVGREVVHVTHQFWCHYYGEIDFQEKDECYIKYVSSQRYRVIYVDDILEKNNIMKIDLLKIE